MKRSLLPALMMLTTSLLFVGCDSSTPSEPESLSPNISGNWSGQTTMFGV